MRNPSARFSRYLQAWWDEQLEGERYPCEWRRGRDSGAIAHEFRRDTQFAVAQAAFLLRRPDERGAREVIEKLEPVPDDQDAALLVEAVVSAGSTAQRVRATTVLGAVLTIMALVVRNILRGR
ncbi:MAG: hypothetical protein ABSA31_08420 [Acidimicrobiales bacterium]|jgi:hypothetical protein